MRSAIRSLIPMLVMVSLAAGVAGAQDERPAEPVSATPVGNPNAVVWRTPEPPADPQKCDVWVNPKDDMEMVYIAPGEFTMGSSNAEIEKWLGAHPIDQFDWFADQQPQCRIQFDGYWIGRTEVTNAQYQQFVLATNRFPPEHWAKTNIPSGLEDYPVAHIDWDDAKAYCEWAGGRLPTEPEWERAARGGDGRTFPWGFQWDPKRCRNLELLTGRRYAGRDAAALFYLEWAGSHNEVREGPAAVASYPSGLSPWGCFDMAGNMSEWCADWYQRKVYERYSAGDLAPPQGSPLGLRVVRGGAFSNGEPRSFRCAARSYSAYFKKGVDIGFRCARDAAQ
ncbi:MAG: SUMF1/EgtB/PvdO family nonheme iron enzyme [Armatimonadota bacterium]|nr:MAG: SUMF1/EgtB/PvdO family nonheme iron enzyme [Armatimonadota bacterium]